jgi:hypothetical protein
VTHGSPGLAPGFLFIDNRPATMVHKSMALTLYDVFALNLDDPDDARCRLAEAVCDRTYFVYVDEAGNEVRLSPDADAPDGTEPIPIWTRDMDLSIVEWTNTDPAIGNVGGAWIRKGEGWARTRKRTADD